MGKCSVENCENKCFEQETKCILHCEKNEKNGWYTFGLNSTKDWNSEKVKLFWKEIRNIISNSQDRLFKFLPIPFNNIVFPKFEGNGLSSNVLDYEDSFFIKEGEKKFTQSVKFNNCTFLDYIYFTDIQFEKDIVFSKCTLKDEIKLKRQQNIRISFLNCPEIKSLDFSRIIFKQKVEIKECVITNCNFENTRFKALADFYKTEFDSNSFYKTTFEDISVFTESIFHENVNFKYTTFEKIALFRKTVFEKTVNFEDAIFKEETNFLEITSKKDEIQDIFVANRETARIIKNSFEQQNNIIEANRFYALEMKKREKELEKEKKDKEKRNSKTFVDYIIFKLHGISSDHSQDPLLALYWIVTITFIYSHLKVFLCQENTEYYIIPFMLNILVLIFILFEMTISKNLNTTYKVFSGLIIYFIYAFITDDVNLECFSNNLNPFSIMTGHDTLNFSTLMYKVIIAYLIYQFIVSVRQNTRRK